MIDKHQTRYNVTRKLPSNVRPDEIDLFSSELKRSFPSPNTYELRKVLLFPDGIVFYRSNLFQPSLRHIKKTELGDLSLAWRKGVCRFRARTCIENGYFATDTWSSGYFHWFCDALPLISRIDQAYSNYRLLLPASCCKPYVLDSLEALKIRPVILNPGELYEIDNLVFSDELAPSGNYHVGAMLDLRERLLANKPGGSDSRKRLFVSRNKASRRKLLNEKAIEPILQANGFEMVTLEDLSYEEQVSLISRSSVLMGVHGAGLTNMLFMPKNATIIEIRARGDAHNNCYFSLANALNLNYTFLISEVERSKSDHIGDFLLSPSELESKIEHLIG